MAVNMTGAVGAYKQVIDNVSSPGMEPRTGATGKSFDELLSGAIETVTSAGAQAEVASTKALTGNTDLNEVVMAVANADIALQTVVAVRDKVIQAYQDILRMPI